MRSLEINTGDTIQLEQLSLQEKIEKIRVNTTKDALRRLPEDADEDAKNRVVNGINKYLIPTVAESEKLALAFQGLYPEVGYSPNGETYPQYAERVSNFLGTVPAMVACPDGRISSKSIIDPRVGRLHRRLKGMPATRLSTKEPGVYVLDDDTIATAIINSTRERKRKGEPTYLVEFLGPHINTLEPEHGCGAAIMDLTSTGRPAINAMAFGGIPEFYRQLGNGYYAFEHAARNAKCDGATTFELIHDAATEGLITGTKYLYDIHGDKMFDKKIDLRTNLIRLDGDGMIVMTEFLGKKRHNGGTFDSALQSKIGKRKISGKFDLRDPEKLAEHIMVIGNIAMELTAESEQEKYPWLPAHLKLNKSPDAIRTYAYHLLRSFILHDLGDIKTGGHDLYHHPERLVVSGPVVPSHNVGRGTIPFIQVTGETHHTEDLNGVIKLYNLLGTVIPTEELKNNARVVVLTKVYDASDHSAAAQESARIAVIKSMENTNAHLRQRPELKDGIANGEAVVTGLMMHPTGRHIEHVV